MCVLVAVCVLERLFARPCPAARICVAGMAIVPGPTPYQRELAEANGISVPNAVYWDEYTRRNKYFATAFMVPGIHDGYAGCWLFVSTAESTRILNEQVEGFKRGHLPAIAHWLYFDVWFFRGHSGG